ncbi:fungal-specific transcription factor domain-containing protein [Mucor mucedo]|uniref:fungal-specific transcription factor domain-containing protein n=1 Tax=Mucor mucedo TaxID=29922 RepID=UPI00221E6BF0|nr:fungal-specific transcription factor domain-containing protein [Mucor mucedo]KAI7892918.1 fungal-specific transcription factor domain-containing protein [Mucor mucedo]
MVDLLFFLFFSFLSSDYCRKKKIKCYFTPGQACTNCVSYGIVCGFNENAKKRGPPKGYIDALEKRIRKMEDSLQNQATATSPAPVQSPSPGPHRQDSIQSNSGIKKPEGASSDKVQYLGDMSSFQLFSNKIQLDDTNRKWKGHHIRKFGKQVVLVEDGKEDEVDDPSIPDTQLVPHVKPIHYWIYSVTGVDRHTSNRLIKIYFANVHPVLPVVNKTRFLQQYRDLADTYPPSDLLNAMFGAAARFVECEALIQKSKANRPPDAVWDVPVGWSDQFFDQAQTIITTSSATPTMSKVQSIILIHNHSGNLDSKSSACWLLGGLAIRLAQGLGLNRDCEEWDIPENEKQTRKRIWWSLYVADRFHSASLGRPISIRDEDNDVGYPDSTASWKEVLDEEDDNDFGPSSPRFPSAMCRPKKLEGRVGIYQLFIELIKLSEILGTILQGLYTPKAKKVGLERGSDAIVTRLDHQLTEWRFGFPDALQKANFEDFDESTGYLAPVTASVLLCYFSLLILLHRPFIEAAANGKKPRSSYSSFRIGTSAATRGIRIASQMTMRDFMMFPYSFSLYPVLQCCLIHMYNTKNLDARISTPAKTDLTKGISLISKLRPMSSTAQRLYRLLKTIMDNKEIEVPVHASDSEESNRSRDNSVDTTPMSSRISDVGRGSNTNKTNVRAYQQPILPPTAPRILTQSPKEQHSVRHFQQSLAEVIAPPHMDGSTISSAPSPTSMSEAFSLKQFGFNNTLGDPNQLDYTMQDVSAFSEMETLPAMPDVFQQQPFTNLHHNHNPSMQHSQVNVSYVPTASPTTSIQSILDNNNEGLFRNNPNNPFFGIPSSMDWTEWNEWSQSNQGNTTWQPPV